MLSTRPAALAGSSLPGGDSSRVFAAAGMSKSGDHNPLLLFALSSSACALSELATFPMDAAKVRLQLQKAKPGQPGYRGLVGVLVHGMREEGVRRFYTGSSAAVARQVVYGGTTMTLYGALRPLLIPEGASAEDVSFMRKLGLGASTGMLGQLVGSPTDLVKIRLQADARARSKTPARYKGLLDALVRIPREEGFPVLFRGLLPNLQRAAVVNAVNLATYDEVKTTLRTKLQLEEGMTLHITSGAVSGFASACAATPLDFVKTRLMAQSTKSADAYTGVVDVLRRSIPKEGISALYKGFWPTWGRYAPWQLVFFVVQERMHLWVLGEPYV